MKSSGELANQCSVAHPIKSQYLYQYVNRSLLNSVILSYARQVEIFVSFTS